MDICCFQHSRPKGSVCADWLLDGVIRSKVGRRRRRGRNQTDQTEKLRENKGVRQRTSRKITLEYFFAGFKLKTNTDSKSRFVADSISINCYTMQEHTIRIRKQRYSERLAMKASWEKKLDEKQENKDWASLTVISNVYFCHRADTIIKRLGPPQLKFLPEINLPRNPKHPCN